MAATSLDGESLYDRLGVLPSAEVADIRAAYRRMAKMWHPDVGAARPGASDRMAALNEAWDVLSDPGRRADYDRRLGAPSVLTSPGPPSPTPPGSTPTQPAGSRRDAWYAGMRLQMARLTAEAGRSAAMALALKRSGHPKAVYDAQIDPVVSEVIERVDERIRAARNAGAAPLDLGLAGGLVGLRDVAGRLARRLADDPDDRTCHARAQMIDHMWDTMAHGITHELDVALGGNPHLTRLLPRR